MSKSKWLSFAGGISIAFVFVHILPELHNMQATLREEGRVSLLFERYLYIISLLGVLLFYGLERILIDMRENNTSKIPQSYKISIFWWHVCMFATFNLIIGYYLHHELIVYNFSTLFTFIALGFHLLIVDYSLLRHHESRYHNIGRWFMATAVFAGGVAGVFVTIPDIFSFALFALVSGAIVVNSFKEELPKDKENNYTFFLTGSIIYTVLLIL
ncbi:MAG: hypothetical protein WD491_10095 [Balneolales bacterium]